NRARARDPAAVRSLRARRSSGARDSVRDRRAPGGPARRRDRWRAAPRLLVHRGSRPRVNPRGNRGAAGHSARVQHRERRSDHGSDAGRADCRGRRRWSARARRLRRGAVPSRRSRRSVRRYDGGATRPGLRADDCARRRARPDSRLAPHVARGGRVTGAPIVSVLVTSYNRERYIGASIESVLSQTFGDFELLVTDNCSTDATLEIARGYERIDRRIRVVVNERNLGQFGNRNRAAELARATLLKYHDSDDVMYPHCLGVMVTAMQTVPEAVIGLSAGRYWYGGPCPMLLTPRLSFQREFLGAGLFNQGPGSAIFRADAFRALGGWIDRGA